LGGYERSIHKLQAQIYGICLGIAKGNISERLNLQGLYNPTLFANSGNWFEFSRAEPAWNISGRYRYNRCGPISSRCRNSSRFSGRRIEQYLVSRLDYYSMDLAQQYGINRWG